MRWFFILVLFSSIYIQAKSLTVGLIDSRPFVWKENGKYTGFHYEIAAQLAEKMKFQLIVKEAPILRMISMLKKGEVDVVIVTDNKELRELNTKKELILELNYFLFTLLDQAITSKQEIRGTIARLSNGCLPLIDYKNIHWVDAESYEQAYGLLKRKRIRAVCGTIAFQIVAQESAAPENADLKSFLISRKGLWIQALPSFDSAIWSEIQKTMKSLVGDGSVATAAKKFSK